MNRQIFKISKLTPLIIGGILLLYIIVVKSFAVTNNSQNLTSLNVDAQDQYLKITNQPPGNSSSTANATVNCNTNQQLVGIIESNTGGNQAGNISADPKNGMVYIGNYTYIPVCTDINWFTFSCTQTTWDQEFNNQSTPNQLDTLQVICATNTLTWEKLNANPNIGTPPNQGGPIGAP